jgi:O-antigen ligase
MPLLISFFDRKLLFLFISIFFASHLFYYGLAFSWLEQQRIAELILGVFACGLWFFSRLNLSRFQSPPVFFPILLLIFVLGLLSSLYAMYPAWALKEWAKFVGLAALAWCIGRHFQVQAAQKALLILFVAVLALSTVGFFAFYAASFSTGTQQIDPYLMYMGFDNPRFYNQFQTVALPLVFALWLREQLAGGVLQAPELAPVGHGKFVQRLLSPRCLAVLLVLQWMIVWALAGRGVLLGLFGALLALALAGRVRVKSWFASYLRFAALGWGLYALMFKLTPMLLGHESAIATNLRFGLSGRELIWQKAWDMILAQPLLGAGPLHYAATRQFNSAHPHQMLLQFGAEWGVPATLLFALLCFWGVRRGLQVFRANQDPLDFGLLLSLTSSLLLAQFDGVFVMPYTETCLALVAGLAMARWGVGQWRIAPKQAYLGQAVWMLLLLLAMGVMGKILLWEAPSLHETSKHFYKTQVSGSPPRFWDQGWIPM